MAEDKCLCEPTEILIFPCSGGSNVGQISNEAAKDRTTLCHGKMSCLAGIGGHVSGLVESIKAAKRIIAIDGWQVHCTKKTLEHADFKPDIHVVVLTVLPKQAMWVANSLLYSSGGPRITANFAGMQASCGDVTVVPILKNMVNFSVGCYGCRSAGKLADDEMYVGIPYRKVGSVVSNLKGLRKAMSSLEKTEVIKK